MADCFTENLTVTLPGGYVDPAGMLHQDVELASLTGREEEILTKKQHVHSVSLTTEILQRCIRRLGRLKSVSEDIIRHLLIADRQYLLLKLRELTFGDYIRATLNCPWADCGKKIMVNFLTTDIPIAESADKGPIYRMELSPESSLVIDQKIYRDITFRLPNGGDQEELAPILNENESQASTLLLQRCIQSIGSIQHPDPEIITKLLPDAQAEIEQFMAQVAPKLQLVLESNCPECEREYSIPFDIQRFFFDELRTGRDRLYREVHYLAYHYHWSEREIMNLSRQKRRAYIAVLTDEIEKLNYVA